MTSGQEGTWEIFSKQFPAMGEKVDARDTWAGILIGLARDCEFKMGKTLFWSSEVRK